MRLPRVRRKWMTLLNVSLIVVVIILLMRCHSHTKSGTECRRKKTRSEHVPIDDAKIFYLEKKFPLKGRRVPPGSVWPQPQSITTTDQLRFFDGNKFTFRPEISCDVIRKACERYTDIIFPPSYPIKNANPGEPLVRELIIKVLNNQCEKYPDPQTFSQLIHERNGYQAINDSTMIHDYPRFKHRGLLIDTARHFIPMSILKKNLDTMAYNKFNVFHWHLVDDQSFPFESKVLPELTEKGAYSRSHVYSQQDVKDIIEYARLRGIRVIPEIDTPGHTASWGKAFPEIITTCWDGNKPFKGIYGKHADAEILNPIVNQTYAIVEKLMEEVVRLFPDRYVHLGMDEVYYDCWKSNPNISQFMKERGFGDNYSKLEEYYSLRVLDIMNKLRASYVVWQDVLDNNVMLKPDTVIQVWKDTSLISTALPWKEYLKRTTSKNYKAILSSCWYLNMISYGNNWKDLYACDPHDFEGTPQQKQLVLGGEACMWGEYVDGTNLLSRLWPRASAVAERLWSAQSLKNPDDAQFRLDIHRCRMLKRGIPAQPVLNGFCGSYEVGLPDDQVSLDEKIHAFKSEDDQAAIPECLLSGSLRPMMRHGAMIIPGLVAMLVAAAFLL